MRQAAQTIVEAASMSWKSARMLFGGDTSLAQPSTVA